MRPVEIDDGCGGIRYEALMQCCGKSISPYLRLAGIDVFTEWLCHVCGATATQEIGTIDDRWECCNRRDKPELTRGGMEGVYIYARARCPVHGDSQNRIVGVIDLTGEEHLVDFAPLIVDELV